MLAAFLLRLWLISHRVDTLPPLEQSARQFRIELALLVGVGLAIAGYNLIALEFPVVRSGLKLVLGFLTMGLFQSVDMTLDRERVVIRQAKEQNYGHALPTSFFPLTKRFLLLTILLAFLISGILILVLIHDLRWFSSSLMAQADVSFLVRSVSLEVLFVMSVLLVLVINLIVSYTRNLQLLLDNQTSVLKQASQGDLHDYVPAVTNDELGFIAGHTNLMLQGLREHLKMTHSLEVAQKIQTDLLPFSAPDVRGLDLAGASIACDAITGDYFDYFRPRDGKFLAVLIGDVSGHGVGSALIMASVRSLIRLRTMLPGSLAESMADVNHLTAQDTFGSGRFMTLFCLMIETSSFSLHWVNAGHDPVFLYSPLEDEFSELWCNGLPLGVLHDSTYNVCTRDNFLPGEIILLGTDGIWEATNPQGEFFGKERLRHVIRAHASGTAQEIVDAVCGAVAAFRGDQEQEDDLTMIVVKALPREGGSFQIRSAPSHSNT